MYYILIGMSLLLGFITKIKHGKKVYCFIMFLALFIVSGWRDWVGYDHAIYIQLFYDSYLKPLASFVTTDIREKGFLIISETISNYTMDYQWLLIVISFIVLGIVMYFIYKYSKNVWLSVFAFMTFGCFYFSMDFVRQAMAGVFCMLALKRLHEDDYFYAIILVLFAGCFHLSAFIMLPLLIFIKIPLNKIVLAVYATGAVGLIYFSETLIQFAVDKGFYSQYGLNSIHLTTGVPIIYGVVTTLIFILAFLFRKDLIKMRDFNKILISAAFFNAFFTLIGEKHAVLSRFSVLLEIPVITILLIDLVLLLIKKCKNVNLRVVILVSFILLSFGYHYYLESNNYNGVFPYRIVGGDYHEV